MASFSVDTAPFSNVTAVTDSAPRAGLSMPFDHSSSSPAMGQNRIEVPMQDKEKLELVSQKMAEVRDASLDARLELAELKFELEEILGAQRMDRRWMELQILWDRAAIAGRSSPTAPYFDGCTPVLRNNLRVHELAYMITGYNRVRAKPRPNLHLRSVLDEIGPNGLSGSTSEELKRKWAALQDGLCACEAKRAKYADEFEKIKRVGPPLEVGDSDLLDQEEDDGKLGDLKRLDKEILGTTDYKIEWKKTSKESYKWYYPYAEVTSREEYLKKVVDWLANRAEGRGTAAFTENEVIGYMLLKSFAIYSLSPSVSNAPFPPSSS